jgi:hypothetical protein
MTEMKAIFLDYNKKKIRSTFFRQINVLPEITGGGMGKQFSIKLYFNFLMHIFRFK